MSASPVWEILARRPSRVVTTEEIREVATALDKDPKNTLRHLRRKLIVPLLKGFYYVRSADEILLNAPGPSPLELFALAAKAKGIGTWYFGLHTALRLNGWSHEYRDTEYVIGDTFYRIAGVRIAGARFVCLRWNEALFGFGLKHAKSYAYSDPEKTALDFAYWDCWLARKKHKPVREWAALVDRVDRKRLSKYARHYPEPVARQVEASA